MDITINKQLVVMTMAWIIYPTYVYSMTAGTKLSDSIIHYEPLYYDHHHLHQQHHRSKRAEPTTVSLDFTAFGRTFNISLSRDDNLFSRNIEIETSHGAFAFDTGRAYTGKLKGDYVPYGSTPAVRGFITTTGHFQGTISRDKDLYIVEKSTKYFKEAPDFHSVIYRASDIKFDFPAATCGEVKHRQNLLKIQKSLKMKSNGNETTNVNPNNVDSDVNKSKGHEDADWSNEHDEHSDWSEKYLRFESKRIKRAIVPSKTTCELYMQADHRFYAQLGNDVEAVIEALSQNVQTVNAIYGAIDFDDDGTPDNINFIVKRVKVHTDPTDPDYRLNGNFGVEKFLELHSEENYDSYCLSYVFTHSDFGGGVLGLAWTAGADQSGGVCEKYTKYSQGSLSLNSGLVTTLNYGKVVSSHVTHLTFAHEIGHNFGSPHDTDGTSCAPGGTAGNYIMYARAISGSQDNNNKFSTCSITAMSPVLENTARSATGCFVEPMGSICGNRVVEDGEECDCGYTADCTESCCNPQTGTTGGPTPCTRKASSVCSPSSGPCCDNTCQYVTAAANQECRANTSCIEAATCNGISASCPASTWQPNKTPCEDSQVCINGTCSGSACEAQDYPTCQCAPSSPGDWKDAKLCTLCCEVGGQCKPSYEINGVPNGTNVPGSPCNNFQGYCDVFYRCREKRGHEKSFLIRGLRLSKCDDCILEDPFPKQSSHFVSHKPMVDPTGIFSRIKKLLSSETLETIKQWLITHWYVPVLAGLGFIILMVIFVKVCGKKVPSDKELYERRMRRYGNENMRMNDRSTVAPTGYM